jgi:hypothetical protein
LGGRVWWYCFIFVWGSGRVVVMEGIGVICQRWGRPQFLVSLREPGFWVVHVTHFKAVSIVEEEVCTLVWGGKVALRIEEASPAYVHAAWEGDGIRISLWYSGGAIWKGIGGGEF